MKASEVQGLQLIADSSNFSARSAWIGHTPEQTVQALVGRAPLMARKYGDLHLLRPRSVPVDPRLYLVPWPFIAELRKAAEQNNGYLGFPELLQIADLRPEQGSGLQEEFPDARPELVEGWRPILRFYLNLLPQDRKQLTAAEGLPFRDAGLVARSILTEAGDPRGIVGVKRLQEFPREAVLSLQVERVARRARPNGAPGGGENAVPGGAERKPETATDLVWIIRVPGQPDFRRSFRYEPRKPLEPTVN